MVAGRVGEVEAPEADPVMLSADVPAEASAVGAIEIRLPLPALLASLVDGIRTEAAVGAVVCAKSPVVPVSIVCAGRLVSFRGNGRGSGVEAAVAV
jgi:hypothetical protein